MKDNNESMSHKNDKIEDHKSDSDGDVGSDSDSDLDSDIDFDDLLHCMIRAQYDNLKICLK